MKKPESILLAKDDENDVLLLRRAIQTAALNASLQVVVDGQEAIEYLAGEHQYSDRSKHPLPRLMLLDLRMPRLDGIEVLRFIRNRPQFSKLPVIVLTSSNNPSDIKRAYEAGATSYFMKPTDAQGVDEMIHVLHAYWLKFNYFAD
jgi:CheY-like chemotaxis protein